MRTDTRKCWQRRRWLNAPVVQFCLGTLLFPLIGPGITLADADAPDKTQTEAKSAAATAPPEATAPASQVHAPEPGHDLKHDHSAEHAHDHDHEHAAGHDHDHTAGQGHENDHAGGHHEVTIRGVKPKPLIAANEQSAFLNVDPVLFIWTLGLFLGGYWILNRYAFPQILESLAQREQLVAAAAAAAAQARAAAAQTLAEQNVEMGKAQEQIKQLLAEARTEATTAANARLANVRQDLAAQQQSALAELEAAKQAALAELESASATLGARLANQLIPDANFIADEARRLLDQNKT